MKIKLSSKEYNIAVTVNTNDDAIANDVLERFCGIMVAFGYAPVSVINALLEVHESLKESILDNNYYEPDIHPDTSDDDGDGDTQPKIYL